MELRISLLRSLATQVVTSFSSASKASIGSPPARSASLALPCESRIVGGQRYRPTPPKTANSNSSVAFSSRISKPWLNDRPCWSIVPLVASTTQSGSAKSKSECQFLARPCFVVPRVTTPLGMPNTRRMK